MQLAFPVQREINSTCSMVWVYSRHSTSESIIKCGLFSPQKQMSRGTFHAFPFALDPQSLHRKLLFRQVAWSKQAPSRKSLWLLKPVSQQGRERFKQPELPLTSSSISTRLKNSTGREAQWKQFFCGQMDKWECYCKVTVYLNSSASEIKTEQPPASLKHRARTELYPSNTQKLGARGQT